MLSLAGVFFVAFFSVIVLLIVSPSTHALPKTVCILSPSGVLDSPKIHTLNASMTFLQKEGFKVTLMPNALKSQNAFAGTDEERRSDLQQALEDVENCSIIMCTRGGYGMSRTIDLIDWDRVNAKRKTLPSDQPQLRLIGYSDVTHILLRLLSQHGMNYLPIHGPMPAFNDFILPEIWGRSLKLLNQQQVEPLNASSKDHNRHGKARGELIGGNLSIMMSSVGTRTEIDTKGRILFIEEVGEGARHLDRMLRILGRSGKFDEVAGLVFGQFTSFTNDGYFPSPMTAEQVIAQAIEPFVSTKEYPIAYGFDFGHGTPNYALPLGMNAVIEVNGNGSRLVIEN